MARGPISQVRPSDRAQHRRRSNPEMRDPFAADQPQLQDVLNALDDPGCRTIVEQLTEPMTAKGISTRCGIPLSTTYRKLDLLSDASLVAERTEVGASGRHTAQYVIDFEEVRVALDGELLGERSFLACDRAPPDVVDRPVRVRTDGREPTGVGTVDPEFGEDSLVHAWASFIDSIILDRERVRLGRRRTEERNRWTAEGILEPPQYGGAELTRYCCGETAMSVASTFEYRRASPRTSGRRIAGTLREVDGGGRR